VRHSHMMILSNAVPLLPLPVKGPTSISFVRSATPAALFPFWPLQASIISPCMELARIQ